MVSRRASRPAVRQATPTTSRCLPCGTLSASACPSPSQYINWDGVHLTEAMYKVLTDMFLNGKATHPPFSYLSDMKLHCG
ncbi:unnamed protein product [Prunus armeniaca]